MDNKVNRELQEKINALSQMELYKLADDYIGKKAFLLFDSEKYKVKGFVYLGKIKSYDKKWFPNGLIHDLEIRDRKVGDKAILFEFENGQTWELIDFAVEGDTINVFGRDIEISYIDDSAISFKDGLVLYFPIDTDTKIKDQLIKIGWIEEYLDTNNKKSLNLQSTQSEKMESEVVSKSDFVSNFLQDNAENLVELEKNNRPLFDVVEMTLNFLNSKFGSGKTATESVENVIVNAEEIAQTVKEQSGLIGLVKIEVRNNEGKVDLSDRSYSTWTAFNDDLKLIYDDTIAGYNKVRFKAIWEDGSYIVDRVDVGISDFNPNTDKVGVYIDRPFNEEDKLKDEPEKYQWDDEIIVETATGEVTEFSKEDIENEISALEIALTFEEDEDNVKAINDKIEALKISLTLI